ncbi:hypothetical protein BBOV_III001785 [Babesia bovis T2Bo]|uniref:hypothetical protein n=1 Tax=Babesia bovis T2Bo TaxID=484906 RepID=UPI001C35579A|nr:hypothetical protein BBOV_III001785 [Babesia bovis T2Bo]KAG6440043.1 hypothetical protein BBOV_III001785 [Babesia bovis T2Bo]
MPRAGIGSLKYIFKSHFTNENCSKVALLGGCCACVYLNGFFLYSRNRKEGATECSRLDGPIPQIFIGDVLSHFTPYLLQIFAQGDWMAEFNKVISDENADFRQRLTAYLCLNKVLRNPFCAKYVFSDIDKFRQVMTDIVEPKELPTSPDNNGNNEPELLFNVKISCLENYLKALSKQDRHVDYQILASLVKLSKMYPSQRAKEKISNVLRLLLENESNCTMLVKKEFEAFESCHLIQEEAVNIDDLVLHYLYKTKSEKSWFGALLSDSHITALYNSMSIDSINKAVKGQGTVLSPLATSKANFEMFQPILSAIEISYAYSFLRTLLSTKTPGVKGGSKVQMAMMDGFKTTRGVLIYHVIFAMQNKLIHSERYFKDEGYMIPMSIALCSTSWLSLSALVMTHRFILLPIMLHRFFN